MLLGTSLHIVHWRAFKILLLVPFWAPTLVVHKDVHMIWKKLIRLPKMAGQLQCPNTYAGKGKASCNWILKQKEYPANNLVWFVGISYKVSDGGDKHRLNKTLKNEITCVQKPWSFGSVKWAWSEGFNCNLLDAWWKNRYIMRSSSIAQNSTGNGENKTSCTESAYALCLNRKQEDIAQQSFG